MKWSEVADRFAKQRLRPNQSSSLC